MTVYRDAIGMTSLERVLNISSLKHDLSQNQKKACKNIKYCTDDQWQYVNSWYDEKSEESRQFVMDPRKLFNTIYGESLQNVYDEGIVSFGSRAKSFLKDIKFCGKKFLQTVVLYYVAEFLEDSVIEVDGTAEDEQRIVKELIAIKQEIGI